MTMPESEPAEHVAGLVKVGDRSLYLECRGSGSPTVILESGYRNRGDVWDLSAGAGNPSATVANGVARFTRVCMYDRPGTMLDPERRSRSDAAPQPRTGMEAVADLHALLTTAGIPGPYVMVGHSIGGVLARLYALAHPDEVAGLVLVDSSHEDQEAAYQTVLSPAEFAAFMAVQEAFPESLADYDEGEQFDISAVLAELRDLSSRQPLGDMPLAVVFHGRPMGEDILPGTLSFEFPTAAFERVSHQLQAELAALTPGGRLIYSDSGHFVHVEQPGVVVEAIRQMVGAVRNADDPIESNP